MKTPRQSDGSESFGAPGPGDNEAGMAPKGKLSHAELLHRRGGATRPELPGVGLLGYLAPPEDAAERDRFGSS